MRARRFRLLAVPALALALVAAAACSKKTTTTASPTSGPTFAAGTTMARLQAAGKVTVGTKFDQPLFGLKNPLTGAIEGFDVEIAKLVVQGIYGGTVDDAAKHISFVETPSNVREISIQQGKVDMVAATYTINDARKKVVDFAGPYYIAGQDIMVKKGDNSIKSVTDLNGKKVCSVQGSTSLANVKAKAPQADLSITFDVYSKCADALKDGRVQAVTTDNVILLGLVKDNKDVFKVVGNPFTTEPYGIGIKKGDDAFRSFINDRLEASYRDGSWAAAFNRTVGTAGVTAPTPPPVDRYASGPAVPTSTVSATVTPSATATPSATVTPSSTVSPGSK
ncbi:MAG TPA: transporter substrate-binding domain-containing protein [Actinomycetota bacterium]|jgi:glutamate transport system substrate-binding protein|nr:transporter substrate-binding domain-containing protein [Actinomycetota bacterium]